MAFGRFFSGWSYVTTSNYPNTGLSWELQYPKHKLETTRLIIVLNQVQHKTTNKNNNDKFQNNIDRYNWTGQEYETGIVSLLLLSLLLLLYALSQHYSSSLMFGKRQAMKWQSFKTSASVTSPLWHLFSNDAIYTVWDFRDTLPNEWTWVSLRLSILTFASPFHLDGEEKASWYQHVDGVTKHWHKLRNEKMT